MTLNSVLGKLLVFGGRSLECIALEHPALGLR